MVNKNEKPWAQSALAAKQALDRQLPSVKRLQAIGNAILADAAPGKPWAPTDDRTFCNFAVDKGATEFGFMAFHDSNGPLLANAIISLMAKAGSGFVVATATEAYQAACEGKFVVACYSETPHGHVAVVAPGNRVWSQKWQCYAPLVFNVGKTVGLIGANFAFRYMPSYYIFVGLGK